MQKGDGEDDKSLNNKGIYDITYFFFCSVAVVCACDSSGGVRVGWSWGRGGGNNKININNKKTTANN